MHLRKLASHCAVVALAAIWACGGRGDAAPPPAPWKLANIGPSITPGFVDVDPRGFWTMRASNGDTSLNADSVFFIHQPLSGDGSVLALLLGQEGGDPQWGKAGLMVRENDTTGAANVHFHMTTGHGLSITHRPFSRQPTVNEGGDRRYGTRQFPIWLRLQRDGDQVTPFSSADGFGWAQLHAPITLRGLPKEALIGLTAASLFDNPVAAAFGNVTVVPGQISPQVRVCAGNGATLLSWSPISGAKGYLVRRSAPNTPGFAADLLTSTPIKETTYSDANLPNGQTVRYLVSAIYDQGGQPVEGWATTITATPIPTPQNLMGCDINLEATQVRGSIVFDPATSTFRQFGSGGDIGNTEDHCFFSSRFVQGDFHITLRMLEKPTKAGVMVRESLEGPSRMAFLAGTTRNGVSFQYREETGGSTALTGKPAILDADYKPPLFLRLVRRGNTISAFTSQDGEKFSPAGSKVFNPPLPESVYVGFASTSQNPGLASLTTFSDLTIGAPPSQ